MENIIKLMNDIFSMDFDVIIPVSGSIIAVLVGGLLFSIRYFTFKRNRKRYEKLQNTAHTVTPGNGEDNHEADISGTDIPETKKQECNEILVDKKPDDKEVNAL